MSVKQDVYLDNEDKVIKVVEDGTKTNHYYRAEKDEKGYISVKEDLGTDYISRITLAPIFSDRSFLGTASYNYQSSLRSEPASYMYNFSDKTPIVWGASLGGMFTAGLGVEATALRTGEKVVEKAVEKEVSAWAEEIVSVFHKGQLNGGVVSSGRSLSTGLERAAVEGLKRTGKTWEFRIPRSVLQKWLNKGWAESKKDYDIATGVLNEEIKFMRQLASELNKYLVK
jgi:hypothetical protein